MNATLILTAGFAALLALEWRYRRAGLRLAAALFALAVLFVCEPNLTGARRQALSAPLSERVTRSPLAGSETQVLSDYQSGVYTTMQFAVQDLGYGGGCRLAAVGTLVWLACSPVFRRAPGSLATDARTGAHAPEA